MPVTPFDRFPVPPAPFGGGPALDALRRILVVPTIDEAVAWREAAAGFVAWVTADVRRQQDKAALGVAMACASRGAHVRINKILENAPLTRVFRRIADATPASPHERDQP
jgi:hypothetical protein